MANKNSRPHRGRTPVGGVSGTVRGESPRPARTRGVSAVIHSADPPCRVVLLGDSPLAQQPRQHLRHVVVQDFAPYLVEEVATLTADSHQADLAKCLDVIRDGRLAECEVFLQRCARIFANFAYQQQDLQPSRIRDCFGEVDVGIGE